MTPDSLGNEGLNEHGPAANNFLASNDTLHMPSQPANTFPEPLAQDTHGPSDRAEEEEVAKPVRLVDRVFRFLFIQSSPYALSVKLAFLATLLGAIGLALFMWDWISEFVGMTWLPALFNCSAFALTGFVCVLVVLHTIVVIRHRRYDQSGHFWNWLTEFELFVAAAIWIAMMLIVFSFASSAKSALESATASVVPSTTAWFLGGYLLAGVTNANILINLAFIALFAVLLAATKRHFMHKLAIQFNYSNYADRVEESLFVEKIMQAMLKSRQAYRFRKKWRTFLNAAPAAPSRKQPESSRNADEDDFVHIHPPAALSPNSPQLSTIESGHGNATRPNSPSPASPHGPAPSNAPQRATKAQFEEFTRLANRTLAQFDSLTGSDTRIEIHREARKLAGQLFKWIFTGSEQSASAQRVLKRTDLEPFIADRAELDRFMLLASKKVKGSSQNEISESDLRRLIDSSLQESYALAKSMETIEMALAKINSILNGCISLISAMMVTVLVQQKALETMVAVSAIISSAAYAFGTSAKNTFESIIFLLVIHPFDVGDRVCISQDAKAAADPSVASMLVVEMHVMSTIFERWDGVRIYIPNHLLAYRIIYNLRRSGPTADYLRLAFAHNTPVERVDTLRARLANYVRGQRQDFTDFHRVNIDMLENCNKMNVTIVVQHASNWQDLELQMNRRTKILSWLKEQIDDLGIVYLPPTQPIKLLDSTL